jgi:serine phosphatase RsbU (regulator of sigma subunit)
MERDPLDLLEEPLLTRLGDRLVEEAGAAAGTPATLYVVDLDGRALRRVAGDAGLPAELATVQLVGPEIPALQASELERTIVGRGEAAAIVPLWLRGRALGVLAFAEPPSSDLGVLATHAAAALELAERYVDVFANARRREECSAAAELQQELLPPRIGRFEGADVAGSILPAYDIGGDWIDQCAMPGGGWLGVADAVGKGAQAAAISALGLGAYRAARRGQCTLAHGATHIHAAIRSLEISEVFLTAVLASWEGATSTFTWLRCGHPPPLVWHRERGLTALQGGDGPLLGLSRLEPPQEPGSATIADDELVILVTDGILERTGRSSDPLGEEGIRRALDRMRAPSATAAVTAILEAVRDVDEGPLRDDASVLVLAPDSRSASPGAEGSRAPRR